MSGKARESQYLGVQRALQDQMLWDPLGRLTCSGGPAALGGIYSQAISLACCALMTKQRAI